MEIFGGLPLPLALALLALIDSLSAGTLLIPLFLLLRPGRVSVGRVLLYLVTIAGFYLLVGLLFLWGLVNLVDVAADFIGSPAGAVTRLIVGGALLLTAFLIPTKPKEGEGTEASPQRGPGRLTRWRDRLLDPDTRPRAIVVVALGAGIVEVATMLPYIMAMVMLAEAGVPAPVRVLTLVGYCILMIVPALVLLLARILVASLVQPPLARLAAWMERTGAENTAWIIGILGFLIARTGASDLGLFDALSRIG